VQAVLRDRAGRYRAYLPLDLLLLGATSNVTADVLTAARSVTCRSGPTDVCGAYSASTVAGCADISTRWGQQAAVCRCAAGTAVYVAGGETDQRTAQVAAGGGYPCLSRAWLVRRAACLAACVFCGVGR
jgi:hypothetical protein